MTTIALFSVNNHYHINELHLFGDTLYIYSYNAVYCIINKKCLISLIERIYLSQNSVDTESAVLGLVITFARNWQSCWLCSNVLYIYMLNFTKSSSTPQYWRVWWESNSQESIYNTGLLVITSQPTLINLSKLLVNIGWNKIVLNSGFLLVYFFFSFYENRPMNLAQRLRVSLGVKKSTSKKLSINVNVPETGAWNENDLFCDSHMKGWL